MPLTLSDIELLEQIAADLKEWANKPDDELLPDTTHLPENKAFSEAGIPVTDIAALKPFNRVMEALRFHKPSVAESVQDLYEILMDGASKVYWLIKEGRKDPLHISMLRDSAVVLADELEHVAQMAREELVAKKVTETEQEGKPVRKTKTTGKVGHPKIKPKEAQRRRKIKNDWEQYRDTIKGANKKKCFCVDYEDTDITVEYLNNSVLRWCRDHPK